MAPKIGPSVNLPTTDPLWAEQRLIDGKELTPEESKITHEQALEIDKLSMSLKQPIQKDDLKAARTRVDSLQKQFESLSPENKKYMYETLQTDTGSSSRMSKDFHYRLSTASRDKLLKTLNPDHKEEHIKKYTMDDARQKAQKTLELNIQGTPRQQEMNKQLEEIMQKKQKDVEKKMDEMEQNKQN